VAEVNITPINNGDNGDANLWNSRFAAITEQINGNIDQTNLADSAVTTPKIPNGAITAAKLEDKHDLWVHYSTVNGQVLSTTSTLVFDTVKRNTGIVYATGTGIATIQRNGWYTVNFSLRNIDVSATYTPLVRVTLPGSSTITYVSANDAATISVGSHISCTATVYLEEGQQVAGVCAVSTNTRVGSSATEHLPYHSYMTIVEVR